jgi:hypothetical protein
MNGKVVLVLAAGLVLGCAITFWGRPPAAEGQAPEKAAKYEYTVVEFRSRDTDDHTRQLTELAANGWEYVGPVNADTANLRTFVAFKRPKK